MRLHGGGRFGGRVLHCPTYVGNLKECSGEEREKTPGRIRQFEV